MGVARDLVVTALAVVLAGCTVATVETPDPAVAPSGPLEARAGDPTGPLVELGSGMDAGLGWRYVIYPSGDEWCTQLELVEVTGGGCGDLLPREGKAFGSVGEGQPLEGGVIVIDGIVSPDTATVWLVNEEGFRAPARLMSLDEAGLEGQAFIAFVPPEFTITHLQALAFSGEVLETYELP